MPTNILAKRYAMALKSFCKTSQEKEATYASLKSILELWDASEDFRLFITNPVLTTSERHVVLEKIFKDKVQANLLQFFVFINQKGRLTILPDLAKEFLELYYHDQNIWPAKILSSRELTPSQKSNLIQHLKLKFRKEIEAEFSTDASLMGGLRIQINDHVFDYSIKTQLDRFYKSILHV
jgi:F-type H+-transporting ATPase subunit delta